MLFAFRIDQYFLLKYDRSGTQIIERVEADSIFDYRFPFKIPNRSIRMWNIQYYIDIKCSRQNNDFCWGVISGFHLGTFVSTCIPLLLASAAHNVTSVLLITLGLLIGGPLCGMSCRYSYCLLSILE